MILLVTEIELLRQQVALLEKEIELTKTEVTETTLTDDNSLSRLIYSMLNKFDGLTPIHKIYGRFWNVFNYMFICGIGGTMVNFLVLSAFINIVPLLIADVFAIGTAALWNYTFTVGPYGYISGLSVKKPKFKKSKEWV
jgi:hypothetical protein